MSENPAVAQRHDAFHAPPSALNLFANPILRRFRRSQMRPVRLGVTILLTLVLAGFIATMAYLPLRYRAQFSSIDAARAIFIPILVYQSLILMVFGTAAIGSGILRETEEGMIEYQRLTPLSPLAKVLGYLFGLPIRQYVGFAITAFFSAFSIIVGEIPFESWGSVYLLLFSATILYHLLGLITGLIIKSRWRAGLISIGLVLLLNVVLPRLSDFGFAMFSHLTIWPVVKAHLADLIPQVRGPFAGVMRQLGTPDVPFWGLRMSHLAFGLVVQGSLILTFVVMLVRRWRDEQAHLLGKGYALGWQLWLQVILLGNVLPMVDAGRILAGMVGAGGEVARALKNVPGFLEARVLTVIYGAITLLLLLPVISCMTPREPTQMIAFRRQKKSGLRRIPWLDDGATAAPFVWIAAAGSGIAWAIFVERLFTSSAFDGRGFPLAGWAVFAGVIFIAGAIFHFLLEAFSRRAAWLTLFLAGFLPLFTSLVLISLSSGWVTTARYLIGFSPLSAPWQPLQWLELEDVTKVPIAELETDFGPFALFCAVHIAMCVALLIAWRSRRRAREARA
jgi:hypothetical protein